MGFFSSIFGTDERCPVEVQLERAESCLLEVMGFPQREAPQMAREKIEQAKKLVRQRQQEREPPNLGDLLLQHEADNPEIRDRLGAVRNEGVTEHDIRDWWNRPPLERALLELSDEGSRMTAFISVLQRGGSPEEAGAAAARTNPVYGDPIPNGGPDGPIPWELRSRITDWTERNSAAGPRAIRSSDFSSFNALVRNQIAAGRL